MKYLLIDGNNLAVRSAFANDQLQNTEGTPTGVHFGVFQSLIVLKKRFPGYQFLIVWDGKSARRTKEALEGVAKGLVPSGYKENRSRGDELPQPLKNFYQQSPYLQKGIGKTGIPQIRIQEFEADDIIASYAKILGKDNEVKVVTSDRDYWQMLDDNVSLWDGMKEINTTKKTWLAEYGLEPSQAIDMGALTGDTSDNIFGIPGWGEKTAIKELKIHGSWENILKSYHEKYDGLRNQYPDLHTIEGGNGDKLFKELKEAKSNPEKENSRPKFPEIYPGIPFSGVAFAFHEGKVKIPKSELMALMFEERIRLAYSLKRMDSEIDGLPDIESGEYNEDQLIEYLEYYDIYTLHDDIKIFSNEKGIEEESNKELEDVMA